MFQNLPTVINNYKFIEPIGQGTYSVVYKVQSIKYNQIFAAKVSITDSSVLSENGTIVDSEFNALQSLDHNHIIRIFDKFFVKNYFVLILEYFPGGTVYDFLCKGSTFNDAKIQKCVSGILDGLVICHEKALAHRDIKPSNIFVDAYGRWKLADFNLCSILANTKKLVKNPAGSVPYVSPEIIEGEAYNPFKADIWALGVTIYQMTTGKLPWTDEEVLSGQRSEIVFPEQYNPELKEIILSMLNEKAEERPSAAEILERPFFKNGKKSQEILLPPRFPSRSSLGNIMQKKGVPKSPSSIMLSAKFILQKGNLNLIPRRNSLTGKKLVNVV